MELEELASQLKTKLERLEEIEALYEKLEKENEYTDKQLLLGGAQTLLRENHSRAISKNAKKFV